MLGSKFGYNFLDDSQQLQYEFNTSELIDQTLSLVNSTANNSIFWDGYAFDINRWLSIDGSNANQNINIGSYNFSSAYFIGDGSALTNLNFNYPHNQELNTTNNVTFYNVDVTNNITAKNGTFEYLNVTEDLFVSNSTIYIGNVSISSFVNNETGQKILSIGDDDTFVNASGYFGDGGFLDNISFVNGTVTALGFTLNGVTVTDWSEVNYTVSNGTVTFTTPSFSGDYSVVLNDTFNFEIAQVIVTPSSTTGSYRFGMYELTGETIDANLITHNNEWNIFKSYPIDGQVSLNFSSVSPAKSFTIKIKYFTNVANP